MSTTGLETFDKTLHATHIWLNEIADRLGPDKHVAWQVLGAVLRVLRDRLEPDLSAHLASQLPLLVRRLYCASTGHRFSLRKCTGRKTSPGAWPIS